MFCFIDFQEIKAITIENIVTYNGFPSNVANIVVMDKECYI